MEESVKRLNKYISDTGYCSRREADKLVEEGRVTLNGVVPEMGTKVSERDEVRIDGRLIVDKTEKLIYLAFNKPVGIECTTNLEVRNNIIDYLNYPKLLLLQNQVIPILKPTLGLAFLPPLKHPQPF